MGELGGWGWKARTDSGVVKEAGLSVNPSKRMNGA
jgi:hypothetical protein